MNNALDIFTYLFNSFTLIFSLNDLSNIFSIVIMVLSISNIVITTIFKIIHMFKDKKITKDEIQELEHMNEQFNNFINKKGGGVD